MPHEFTVSFHVPGAARLHLPWQGCWQVPARRLASPVELIGAHLPVMAWETSGKWTLARVSLDENDAVWGLRLTAGKGKLEVRLQGDWQTPPTWTVRELPDYDGLLAAIRAELPPVEPGRPVAFARAFILDIHNVRGTLVQRFDDVARFLEQCAALGLARGSILYLPGWAGPFDGNYPDYEPAADAGGRDGLARLAAAARAHGAWVVPHVNHWALTKSRQQDYPQFLPHILEYPPGKKGEWPGIRLMEISHALWYIDPSCEPWLDHMTGRMRLLESLGIEAVMMDQAAPPLGENWRRQTRQFMREMHARFPRLILGSESVHADILNALGFAQLWGPVWSAMPEIPVLKPSPLLADAVRPWLPIVGHLSTPAPYPAPYAWTQYVYLAEHGPARMFRTIWDFHRASGVLPTTRLVATRHRANERVLRMMAAESAERGCQPSEVKPKT